MKKLFMSLFALWTVAMLAGCGTTNLYQDDLTNDNDTTNDVVENVETTDVMNGYKLYTSNDYNFSIQYPTTWNMEENAFWSHVMMFTPQVEWDNFRENVGVITEELPSTISVDEYYKQAKVHLIDFIADFDEVKNENMKVAGYDAKKIQYLGSQWTYNLKWQQVFFIKDKTTYVVTYTAMADTFDEFVGTVDEMIETMTVK